MKKILFVVLATMIFTLAISVNVFAGYGVWAG